MKKWDTIQGNIHVLRKHKGGREGVSQMLTFAYGGGGAKGSCLCNHSLEKKCWIICNNLHRFFQDKRKSLESFYLLYGMFNRIPFEFYCTVICLRGKGGGSPGVGWDQLGNRQHWNYSNLPNIEGHLPRQLVPTNPRWPSPLTPVHRVEPCCKKRIISITFWSNFNTLEKIWL